MNYINLFVFISQIWLTFTIFYQIILERNLIQENKFENNNSILLKTNEILESNSITQVLRKLIFNNKSLSDSQKECNYETYEYKYYNESNRVNILKLKPFEYLLSIVLIGLLLLFSICISILAFNKIYLHVDHSNELNGFNISIPIMSMNSNLYEKLNPECPIHYDYENQLKTCNIFILLEEKIREQYHSIIEQNNKVKYWFNILHQISIEFFNESYNLNLIEDANTPSICKKSLFSHISNGMKQYFFIKYSTSYCPHYNIYVHEGNCSISEILPYYYTISSIILIFLGVLIFFSILCFIVIMVKYKKYFINIFKKTTESNTKRIEDKLNRISSIDENNLQNEKLLKINQEPFLRKIIQNNEQKNKDIEKLNDNLNNSFQNIELSISQNDFLQTTDSLNLSNTKSIRMIYIIVSLLLSFIFSIINLYLSIYIPLNTPQDILRDSILGDSSSKIGWPENLNLIQYCNTFSKIFTKCTQLNVPNCYTSNILRNLFIKIDNSDTWHVRFSTLFIGFFFIFMLISHLFITKEGRLLALISSFSLFFFQFRLYFKHNISSVFVWCEWICIASILLWSFKQVLLLKRGKLNFLLQIDSQYQI